MPAIWLDRDECRDLPPFCLRCGADATVTRRKTFRWYPSWVNVLVLVGLLPWLVVALILTRSITVHAPMCDRHRNYWTRRKLIAYGLILADLAVVAAGLALGTASKAGESMRNVAIGLFAVGGFGFLVVLAVGAVLLQWGISPTEITDDEVRLSGVCRDFIDAVREQRRDEREQERQRKRARYDDEDQRQRDDD